jgi:hypothetical protein
MSEPLTTPRQVKLRRCAVFSPMLRERAVSPAAAEDIDKNGIDISKAVLSLDIYESIFDNTISGKIEIRETDAYPELFPLVGMEFLLVDFSVDYLGEERVFRNAFRLRRLGDQTFPKNEERTYTLELVTPEFMTSLSSRLIRKYNDTTCKDAVYDVLKNVLKIPDERIKKIDDTDGKISIVIPNYTPLQTINFFTNLALTKKTPNESNFLFFQTLDGFYFTSIASLVQGPVVATYQVNANKLTGASSINEKDAYNTVIGLHQEQSFDVTFDISTGVLRTKLLHIDFFGRKWNEVDSRYTETFKKTTHLDDYPLYPDNFDQSVSRNAKIFIIPTNISSANSKYIESIGDVPAPQRMYESIVLRNRQLREIQHFRTVMDVPGQPALRAGAVIELNYPSTRALAGATGDPTATPPAVPTPYYSGKHLVTSVRHKLTQQALGMMEYRMHIEVARDSLAGPLSPFIADANDIDGKAQ